MPPPRKKLRLGPTQAVEEITFDLSARQEYLTGFHKRKLARAKHAREIAERREREDRIRERKKLRESRAQELEQRIKEVNANIRRDVEEDRHVADVRNGEMSSGSEVSEDEEDGDVEDNDEKARLDHEDEYVDEDKYTTVVVEEVDVDRDGLHTSRPATVYTEKSDEEEAEENGKGRLQQTDGQKAMSGKRKWTKEKPSDGQSRPKRKRKKFRYESKAERKVTRHKERSKNSEQARARRKGERD